MIDNGIIAISFDIWGTLLNGNKAFTKPRLQHLFSALDITDIDIEMLVSAYRASGKHCDAEMERTGLDIGMGDRLAFMFKELGLDRDVPSDQWINDMQVALGRMRLLPEYCPMLIEPDLLQTLQALKDQGYRLGTMSNTGIDNELGMRSLLNLNGIASLVNVTVFSSEVGLAKPNPDFFRHMAQELGTETQNVLHIGDNPNADYRATEAGMSALLYAPKGTDKPLQYIRSMKELLKK